jgi:hypothetical protein
MKDLARIHGTITIGGLKPKKGFGCCQGKKEIRKEVQSEPVASDLKSRVDSLP